MDWPVKEMAMELGLQPGSDLDDYQIVARGVVKIRMLKKMLLAAGMNEDTLAAVMEG